MKALYPLEWSLMISGSFLFSTRSLLVKLAVFVHGFGLFATHIILTHKSVISINVQSSASMFFEIWGIVHDLIAITTVVLFWKSRVKLLDLMNCLFGYLSDKNIKDLRRLCMFFFVTGFTFILIFRFLNVVLLFWSLGFGPHMLSLRMFSLIYAQFHLWDYLIPVVYIVFVKMIHLAEQHALVTLLNQELLINPVTVYDEIRRFILIKDKFVASVSYLPPLLFFFVFGQSVAAIIYHQATTWTGFGTSIQQTFTQIIMSRLLINLILLSYMSLLTSNLSKQSREKLDFLESKIIHSNKKQRWIYVLEKIKEAKGYEFKAYGFFSINKQLLLSFLSSLVSFTVLFVQLINQGDAQNKQN